MLQRVAAIRQLIVDRVGENPYGFSSNVPPGYRAGFSDRNQTQAQSCIYRCNSEGGRGFPVRIYLQFGASAVERGMTVTLLDRTFTRITLALFDSDNLPGVENRVADKNALVGNLLQDGDFPNDGRLYNVGNPVNFRKKSVGHILDLDLLDDAPVPACVISEVVPVVPYDNAAMINQSREFVEKAAQALNDLFPVARRYADNRTEMFIRRR